MWRQVTRGAGLVILIGFVLPWVTISCDASAGGALPGVPRGGQSNALSFTFSGYQLAAGTDISVSGFSDHVPGTVALFLVPLAAAVALGITFWTQQPRTSAIIAVAVALLAAVQLLNAWQGLQAQRQAFWIIQPQIGLWLALLGDVGVLIGGLMGLGLGSTANANSPVPASPFAGP